MTNMATRVQSVIGQRGAYVKHVMQKKKNSIKKIDFMWQF